MRPDQIQRLQDLTERLADAFLLEADPSEWPGDGVSPAELTQEERGNRYWVKKNAMATGGVLRFTMDIVAKQTPATPGVPAEGDPAKDSDIDRQIRDAERRSGELVTAALERAKRKPEFDKRVNGK